MADERIIRAIMEKCIFLYDDAILSKEIVITKYLDFLAKQFNTEEKTLSFAFHTGSICFDAVSLAALIIGCLSYEFSTNDEILADLQQGDMVLYKGERYRWGGLELNKVYSEIRNSCKNWIVLIQDAVGKQGEKIRRIPYEGNKHLIKPYYGNSSVTDGRGVRREKTNRADFISYILGIDEKEVPSTLDISVVVVADKNEFFDIYKHLRIRYNNKIVNISDVVPCTYYSGSGEQLQIGNNVSKAEAVIKVTSKMSIARELVLDRSGNKVIGLMVTNVNSMVVNTAELNDLLRRKNLKFANVVVPLDSVSYEYVMEQYQNAKLFACTKDYLSRFNHEIVSYNGFTKELNQQVSNIIKCKKNIVKIDGFGEWEKLRGIKNKIYLIKQSKWTGEDKDNFIVSALTLFNLFNSSFFSMKKLSYALSIGALSAAIISPEERFAEMKEICDRSISVREQCEEITKDLMELYEKLYDSNPKEIMLTEYLKMHSNKSILLIVPKAYYAELFSNQFSNTFPNVVCVNANRFDARKSFDEIIATSDITGKKFDAIQCYAAHVVTLLLYDFEEKAFSFRNKKYLKIERRLNAKISGKEEYIESFNDERDDDLYRVGHDINEFLELDEFVDSIGTFDIRTLTKRSTNGGERTNTAEVKFVGTFTTGEQILFSKYYSAVVYDPSEGMIKEVIPEKLIPGDILVFTKRNDYTSNIVDQILDQLMSEKKLDDTVQEAEKKSIYWKEALREYKRTNNLSFRDLTKEIKKHGGSFQEVTVRQWLSKESHIVGPRNEKTIEIIAKLTGDPYLLKDSHGYFEACRLIRHYRREILLYVAEGINDKLSNKQTTRGSFFEVVCEDVDKLAEMMELEKIYELEDIVLISSGMVNRPISEAEV